jgi:hypothetical protein
VIARMVSRGKTRYSFATRSLFMAVQPTRGALDCVKGCIEVEEYP